MDEFLHIMKDPVSWKHMMIVGGIVIAFNLIRLIVVVCKVKKAETYLYHGAEAFDGMAMGCGIVALCSFVRGTPVVGTIAAVFAFIFFCCDRKYTWIRHNAAQDAQDILDSAENQQSTQSP